MIRTLGAAFLVLAAGSAAAGEATAPAPVPVLSVVRTISLGSDVPRDISLSRDGATLLVACSSAAGTGGKVKVLKASTGKPVVRDIEVGGPTSAVAISPAGRWGFVAGAGNGSKLTRLQLVKGETASDSAVCPNAGTLVFSEDGKFVYVGGEGQARVDIVDAQWNQIQGGIAGLSQGPRRGVLVPGGRFLYLSLGGGRVAKADLVTAAVAKMIPVNGEELAVSADGARLFVGASDEDTEIKIIATEDDAAAGTIDTELVPGALAADPAGRWLWVALPRNGKVGLVDLGTRKLVATVKTGRRPARLALSADGRTAYCANSGDSTISVVSVEVPEPPAPAEAPKPAVPAQPQAAAPVATPSATAFAVAVTDFESQGVAGSVASIVTEWLRDEVLKAGAYRMLERRRMDALLAEQSLQQTGCTDQDCAVKLGKLLNVQRMLVGSLGKFEEAYVIVARLIDVESGQVVWSGTAKGKSGDDVEAAVRRLAREVSASGK